LNLFLQFSIWVGLCSHARDAHLCGDAAVAKLGHRAS
jgi:hypothetical protein